MLEDLPGVQGATVDATNDRATVVYNPEEVDVQAMITAVEQAGYTARVTSNGARVGGPEERERR